MSIRDRLEKHRPLMIGLSIVAIVVAAFLIFRQSSGVGAHPMPPSYFSVDDGATWFEAPMNSIPPFDHEGKEAVRAQLCSADHGKTKKLAWLEKYPLEVKKKVDGIDSPIELRNRLELQYPFMLVKRSGEGQWVTVQSPAGQQVITLPEGFRKVFPD